MPIRKSKKSETITVTLAIIAKNEFQASKVIWPLIPRKSVDEIIYIDGASKDDSMKFYKSKGIRAYKQIKSGLGAATIEARKHTNTDAMIIFHPDGNEDPKDIEKVAKFLKQGHKFVIPSRMMKGGYNEEDSQFLKPRKWFNICFGFFINATFNRGLPYVTEIVQGYRGIDVKTFDKIDITVTNRTIDCHMVIRAMKKRVPIYQFPTHEGERISGVTNFKSFETGYLNIKTFLTEVLTK